MSPSPYLLPRPPFLVSRELDRSHLRSTFLVPSFHSSSKPTDPQSPKPIQMYYFSRDDKTPINDPYHDGIMLCKLECANQTNSKSKSPLNSTLSKEHNSSSTATKDTGNSRRDVEIGDDYVPYVIGVTPTYYRLTQRLELTSLCQTLMNVPRFLWVVVEDASETSAQVKEILERCQVRT